MITPPVLYLDSSALVKRYIPEPGTDWIRHIVATSSVAMAEFGIVEVAAALARRARMGNLDPELYDDLLELFLQDVEGYLVLSPDRETIRLAVDLTRRHPLRAYDALQLADALHAERFSLTFVFADERLCAARWEGLTTVNLKNLRNS